MAPGTGGFLIMSLITPVAMYLVFSNIGSGAFAGDNASKAALMIGMAGFGAVGAALFEPPLVIGDAAAIDPAAAREMVEALRRASVKLGDNREADLWRAVVLIRLGDRESGRALIAELTEARPSLRQFVAGLEAVGILPPTAGGA